MCVQYCGGYHEYHGGISWVPWGCSVPWGDIMSTMGVFSTLRDSMINVGDIMSTVGVQYRGGHLEYRGGCLEYRGGVQYCGGIMIHVGDIMMHLGIS